MALIEVKNLSKIYRDNEIETIALGNINLTVHEGEFVAIVGPSGSGKSTLLQVLGCLDRPTSGEYLIDGKALNSYSDDELALIRNKKMGFVFQAFNLLPRLSVLENVKLPLFYSAVPEEEWEGRVLRAIEAVGLSERKNHEAAKLSGGEKQRAAIARALVNDPQIIFADEPTGNLDSKSGGQVMEIIQRLNEEEGRTVILITHETYTAQHARRVIELWDGKIVSDNWDFKKQP